MRRTQHIKERMRQRAVTPEMLQLVMEHGEYLNAGDRIHFSAKSATKLLSKLLKR